MDWRERIAELERLNPQDESGRANASPISRPVAKEHWWLGLGGGAMMALIFVAVAGGGYMWS